MESQSVLDPVRHARLLEDIEKISMTSGVPTKFIKTSMKAWCHDIELDYVSNFRVLKSSHPGLLLPANTNVEERCMAIGGAFLRNFIDARVMSLLKVLDLVEAAEMPSPTVLLIPNLQINSSGKALPSWKVGQIYDLLVDRWSAGKQTVIGVESTSALSAGYGAAFSNHIKSYYGAQP